MTTALYTHEFTWAGEAGHVIATGSFDDWKSSLPLTKNAEGKLTAKLPVPYGEKITFKYVVDGNWQYNPDEPHEADASGNINNVFTTPAAPPAAQEAAATVIPLPTTQTETPALPVPASVAEVAPKVDSVAQPIAPAAEAKTETPAEAKNTQEDKPDLLNAATAGVAAIALGAAGLVGAGVAKVTGHNPVQVDPTPGATTSTAKTSEIPPEPTHTPAVPPPSAAPTTSLPTVPAAAAIQEAVEKNEHVKTATGDVKPIVAVAGAGAVAAGAGAAALASKPGEAAGLHTGESATFQTGEKYLKGFAAKAGKEKELHDIAVKADGYLAQAKAEGSKRYAEGETLAGNTYEKVAATSFGASVTHAFGLDKGHPSTEATVASGMPKVNAVPDPAAPGNQAANQTLGSTMAVTDPAAPKIAGPPAPAPAAANVPASPAKESYSTAPSTPLKSAPATPVKGQNSLGLGEAPGSGTSNTGKPRKPSFFKRLLSGKSSSPSSK